MGNRHIGSPLAHICASMSLHERGYFYRRFTGDFAGKACSQGHSRRSVRCMRILQSPCLQGFTLSC